LPKTPQHIILVHKTHCDVRSFFVNQNDGWEKMSMKIVKHSSHTIEITGITHEGQGVGAIEGFPVVVDMAIPGEIVAIKIITYLSIVFFRTLYF